MTHVLVKDFQAATLKMLRELKEDMEKVKKAMYKKKWKTNKDIEDLERN
jgi:hypothetical protein